MEYKLRFTDITTLRPYMFAVGGALWGVCSCMATYKLRLPQSPFIGELVFVLRCRLRINSASAYIL